MADSNISPSNSFNRRRKKRLTVVTIVFLLVGLISNWQLQRTIEQPPITVTPPTVNLNPTGDPELATTGLAKLPVKGRAAKTGYSRAQFGSGWGTIAGCDTREQILSRDLTQVNLQPESCVVVSGSLLDPYTAKTISFNRGQSTSSAVQIDHIVALSDAWQKGAQELTPLEREALANDPLELLAVDGPTNQNKGDGDAATWLPPNKAFRCQYIARQIAIKLKYRLWVTSAEQTAMAKVLGSCPNQNLPA